MADTTITKIDSKYSPKGHDGEKYLASGVHVSMRLWENEQPGEAKEAVTRPYETVGYVISGRAELQIEGQTVVLEPGNSWVVPKGSSHSYKVLEAFTAVEATTPPAQVHGREEA
ncbi:cupin domain-containing protein [Hymenobacter lucidus]|uniref:Cupin domain-containing protein n=1 Tax=Hymenobacter lucidus TaxID=2880930 RepID=A0ABS8AS02_9BACT|nr:cupin domain-containing protein [Hymenobacter lucidus]MCB2408529.1 cupin domain-containing protein [Hymenobacter lucidus]